MKAAILAQCEHLCRVKERVPETSQKIFGIVYILIDSRMEKAAQVKCLHLQIPKFKSNYRRRRRKVRRAFFLRFQSQDLGVFEVILQGRKEKAEAYCDLNKAKELGTCDQRVE